MCLYFVDVFVAGIYSQVIIIISCQSLCYERYKNISAINLIVCYLGQYTASCEGCKVAPWSSKFGVFALKDPIHRLWSLNMSLVMGRGRDDLHTLDNECISSMVAQDCTSCSSPFPYKCFVLIGSTL